MFRPRRTSTISQKYVDGLEAKMNQSGILCTDENLNFEKARESIKQMRVNKGKIKSHDMKEFHANHPEFIGDEINKFEFDKCDEDAGKYSGL